MNFQLTRYIPPLFQFDKFNKIQIIRNTKIWICNIYLPNILNLLPRIMENKRKYKEIESDDLNELPQRGGKRQKMRESKDSGRTVALMTKKNAKSSKPLKWINQS